MKADEQATERTSLPLPAEILSDERSTPDGLRDKSSCPSCVSLRTDLASLKAELQNTKDQEVDTRMLKPEMSAAQPAAEHNEATPHDAERSEADPRLDEIDAIEHAEFELEQRVAKFLRSCGWDHTCDTPGSFWLWHKEFKGKRVTAPRELAYDIEKRS